MPGSPIHCNSLCSNVTVTMQHLWVNSIWASSITAAHPCWCMKVDQANEGGGTQDLAGIASAESAPLPGPIALLPTFVAFVPLNPPLLNSYVVLPKGAGICSLLPYGPRFSPLPAVARPGHTLWKRCASNSRKVQYAGSTNSATIVQDWAPTHFSSIVAHKCIDKYNISYKYLI